MGVGRLRRQRGYAFEHVIETRVNDVPYWKARRLGGSSTGLPDLVVVNNDENVILAIEAKSTQSDWCYVPKDQVQRCYDVLDMFSLYQNRHVILAFKFMGKTRATTVDLYGKKVKGWTTRDVKEHYFKVSLLRYNSSPLPITDFKANYKGQLFFKSEATKGWEEIPSYAYRSRIYQMPWQVLAAIETPKSA